MSHHLDDDDALDAALRALGNPDGSAPVASSGDLLGRIGVPAQASPVGSLAGAGAIVRGGLAGGRLVAAVLLAMGAGFGGGILAQRRPPPAGSGVDIVSAGVHDGSDVRVGGIHGVTTIGVAGLPVGTPASDMDGRAEGAGDAVSGGSPPVVTREPAKAVRARRPGHPRSGPALEDERPIPDASPRGANPSSDEDDRGAGGGVSTTASQGETADEVGDDLAVEALAPGRREPPHGSPPPIAEVVRPDGDARPFVVTAGVGAVVSRLPPRLDADDASLAEVEVPEARLGPFATLGATWRGSGAPRVGYAGLAVEGGRLYAEDHALASVGGVASAGVSWGRPGSVRFDLGGTVGARTVWGRHPREDLHAGDIAAGPASAQESTGERVDEDEDREEAVRGARLSVGPSVGVAIGADGAPRWSVQFAPQLALSRSGPAAPWLQLSLGCELPVGRRSGG